MAVAAALTLCGAGLVLAQTMPPDIPFAPNSDPSLKDPDNPTKVFRLDFARVDEEFPLSRADLMKITPENLAVASQEQLDQIYARSSAGPVPDGAYLSNLFFPHGEDFGSRLGEIVGGMKGRARRCRVSRPWKRWAAVSGKGRSSTVSSAWRGTWSRT